jgi:hypothetical protein
LPAAVTDFSFAIAEKELLRSLTEIDVLLALPVDDADALPLAAALLLELLELLQPAATRAAAAAAAAANPAFFVTEYNGVPRSFTQTCRESDMCETRSVLPGRNGPGYLRKC